MTYVLYEPLPYVVVVVQMHLGPNKLPGTWGNEAQRGAWH